jgi:hypothetical protein
MAATFAPVRVRATVRCGDKQSLIKIGSDLAEARVMRE